MRVKRESELYAIITKNLGALRYKCISENNDTMIVKPRHYLKRRKVKVDDVVLIEPWVVQSTERGFINYIYNKTDTYRIKDILPKIIAELL